MILPANRAPTCARLLRHSTSRARPQGCPLVGAPWCTASSTGAVRWYNAGTSQDAMTATGNADDYEELRALHRCARPALIWCECGADEDRGERWGVRQRR
eukprot:1029373-Rhodomonas_salina.1